MATHKVRVLDLHTHRLTTIPASELAPGMVRARVHGVEGDVWLDPSQVRQGPLVQPPLGEDVRRRVREISDALREVVPLTAEEWEDALRRDANPAGEVEFWEAVAAAYGHFTGGRLLSEEQKPEVLEVIFAFFTNGPEFLRVTTSPVTLSADQVQEITNYLGREVPGAGTAQRLRLG